MNTKAESATSEASFIISFQEGQLRFRARIPVRWLRWMLILAGTISATMGYPRLLEIANQLLNVLK
jgi:hypothetical protein